MASAPRFPSAADGYDRDAVDRFIVRLVDKARAEIDGLRAQVAELETAIRIVAEEHWDPFEEALASTVSSADGPPDPHGEPWDVSDRPAAVSDPIDEAEIVDEVVDVVEAVAEEVERGDAAEETEDERRDRIAALVEARIRGRRLSSLPEE